MAVHDMLENYYPDVNFGLRTIVFGCTCRSLSFEGCLID